MKHAVRHLLAVALAVVSLQAFAGPAADDGASMRPYCPKRMTCGHVQAVTAKERLAKSSGVGTVGGAVLGGILGKKMSGNSIGAIAGAAGGAAAGNYAERKIKSQTVDVVTVRLDGGGTRTFEFAQPSGYQAGQRVQFNGPLEASRMSHM
ncbi:MAG TPA: glycine zipper 2TM domain-containing protein [Burkholderiaceae bacterium]|nr:glycine zipper 2TM domain-containing protein [Burkholderiaceae bacterium]